MEPIINLTDTPRAAFLRGFWRGLAAPVVLFGSFSLPDEIKAPEFKPLPKRPSKGPHQDWQAVGNDLRQSMGRRGLKRG